MGELIAILQMPGRVSVADSRLRSVAADAVSTALDVIAETQERYLAVQKLDALIPVLQERMKLTDRLLTLAQKRLEAGEGTRLDVTTLHTQKLGLEVELRERQLERRQERLALARGVRYHVDGRVLIHGNRSIVFLDARAF